MKIILVSFFDSKNIGDRLIGAEMYKQLSDESLQVSLFNFTTAQNYLCDDILRIDNIEIMDGASIQEPENNYQDLKKASYVDVVKQKIIPAWAWLLIKRNSFWAEFDNTLETTDALCIGGGNMLMDRGVFPSYTELFKKYIALAEKHSKPIYLIDVGAGPFRTRYEKRIAIHAVKKCYYSSSRDKWSQRLLSIKQLSRDPAFLLPFVKSGNEKDCIAISVFNDESILKNCYNSYLVSFANIIKKLGKSMRVVLFSTELSDYKAVFDLYDLCPGENVTIAKVNSLEDIITLYSRAKLIIGTRMHSLIISITQHIPAIAISWDKKIDSLYDLGNLQKYLFHIDSLNAEGNKVVLLANEILNGSQQVDFDKFLINNQIVLREEYSIIKKNISST